MTKTGIRELRVTELRIPFRTAFRHASAERHETSNLWIEAISDDGATTGYGESCPRPYVTGESISSARQFISAYEPQLREVNDLDALRAWTAERGEEIDRHPAAWCAVELALLDLFARTNNLSMEAFLGLSPPLGPFRFTAVLGDSAPDVFAAAAEQYRKHGFTDFKIKLAGDLARDRAKIEVLRGWNSPVLRVRADANNLWRTAREATRFLRALDYPLFAVEEPIGANQYEALAGMADALGCPIILDESLLRAGQIAALPGPSPRWIVNVRVSKMGGLVRALDVVRTASAARIGIIVGAQVGETSLLTRAALSVAHAAGPGLVAQEGAFGTHLLHHDVCDPPLMFGAGGVLDLAGTDLLTRPGFGLTITGQDRQTAN